MEYPRITKKPLEQHAVKPNLQDYPEAIKGWSWDQVSRELDWFDKEHLNIAHVAIDAHLKATRRNKKALIWESKKGEEEEYTFLELSRLSNKFANVLVHEMGVKKGDRVFFFLERVPEIYIAILGTLKAGGVIGPLFSAFGPDAVKDRVGDSEAKVLITSPSLKKKIVEVVPELPALKHIILVNRGEGKANLNDLYYDELMAGASESFDIVKTHKEDYAIMHYTSGTTGKPKGAVHVHEAVVGHYATAKYVLDLQEGDIYWCTADPGWVTGTSYGMFGPWSNGATQGGSAQGTGMASWNEKRSPFGIRPLRPSGC
jgi:acetyl-CoA synthetase